MIQRFQPTMIQNPFEDLLSLKQTCLVKEYIEQVERYVGYCTCYSKVETLSFGHHFIILIDQKSLKFLT